MLLPDKKKKKTRRFAYIQCTVYCTVIIYYYNCIVQFIQQWYILQDYI